MNLEEVLHVFRTDEDKAKLLAMQIANDRGREVLECIFQGRPKSASEIARELEVPLPTVMFHIDRFLEIGIIKIAKTRMSRKLREIKYYGPAKRAILIIPYQEEETMSYIANAVKTSVITPLTVALVVAVSGVAGYIVRKMTAVEQPLTEALVKEAEEGALPFRALEPIEPSFFSWENPILLVLLGCIVTVVILKLYSSIKK